MNCKKCNLSIEKGDKFCSECGYLNQNYKENLIDRTVENTIKIVKTKKELVTQEITNSNYVNKYWNLLNNISLNFSFYLSILLFLYVLFFQTDYFRDAIKFTAFADDNIYSDITITDLFSNNYLFSNSFYYLFHISLAIFIYPILFSIIKYKKTNRFKNFSLILSIFFLGSAFVLYEYIKHYY